MRFLKLLAAILVFASVASFASAEWVTWEDFNTRPWSLEPWPITEGSQISFDNHMAISGSTSLRTTINVVGWGGGLTLRSAPILPPPKQGLTVAIRCEAQPGATGVPNAKFEVYSPDGGPAMGSPDTPLKVGDWTTIRLPASVVTKEWSGCGVIFLEGTAKGSFKIWVDAITLDGKVWEDFEYNGGFNPWFAANINGAYRMGVVGSEYKRAPDLGNGTAMSLAWTGDTDGAELKTRFESPKDISGWKRIRVRVAVPSDSVSPRVSLWMWDGSEGSLAVGDPVIPTGDWVDRVFDVPAAAGAVNLHHVVDFGLVFHEYPGSSGEVIVDRIDVDGIPASATRSSTRASDGKPQWSAYEPNMVMQAAKTEGKAVVYVRSAKTDRCREFEKSVLQNPQIAKVLAGMPLAYLNVDSPENTRLSAEIGVVRVPALVIIEGENKARQLVVDTNTSNDEVIAFLAN
ncbi:hypothetical protein KQI84_17160 [bacterium]|nr:hypothetical protein [bacterium]